MNQDEGEAIHPEPPIETQPKCVDERVRATNHNTASGQNKNQSDVITGSDTRVPHVGCLKNWFWIVENLSYASLHQNKHILKH